MNSLKHKEKFAALLKDYHLSEEAKATLAATRLVVLAAPSGGGRNTIINELAKTKQYYFIVSDTTRQPRSNNGIPERDGVEYWFRKEEDMLADIEAGSFLEAEIIHDQQVSGISIRELRKANEAGLIAITDVDITGVANVTRLVPQAVDVLVLPPSFSEWQRRLKGRGEMDSDELKRRLQTACRIFKVVLDDPKFIVVINDNFMHAAAEIDQLVQAGTVDAAMQKQGRILAQQLLDETTAYLKSL